MSLDPTHTALDLAQGGVQATAELETADKAASRLSEFDAKSRLDAAPEHAGTEGGTTDSACQWTAEFQSFICAPLL